MKRVAIPELLDTDAGTPSEVAASLSDLRWFNRWFGGTGTTQVMVADVARQTRASSLSLLEVAAGAGYVPAVVRDHMARHGTKVDVVLLDRALSHLRGGSSNGVRAVAGDAVALPFADGSFDVVSSCLFTHHLASEELVRFVDEGLRVCRKAVLINDLVRHPIHLGLVYAGTPLYRSRLTRHDAPASVRQAYTVAEMRETLARTQAAAVEVRKHFLFRMGVVVWKQ
ncbi:MAG: methyltransferase domain-containing protein [Acidobacteriia bacterium]|nr:methyltransferase domain-containing protein [Terriglobia bacterium]